MNQPANSNLQEAARSPRAGAAESSSAGSRWIAAAGINAFLAVAAGAFAAHTLKDRISAEMLAIFQTGAQYHMVHALALLGIGLLARLAPPPGRLVNAAGWAFLLGIVLFSGSLYALALSGTRAFGAITPFGGVAFLIGWLLVAVQGLQRTRH